MFATSLMTFNTVPCSNFRPEIHTRCVTRCPAEMQTRDRGRRVLGRRDANVFIRSVRRHGMVARLPVIAMEVGRAVERAPESARLGLWYGMLAGCDQAMAEAVRRGKDVKVRIATQAYGG